MRAHGHGNASGELKGWREKGEMERGEMEERRCCEERWRKAGAARRDGGKRVLRGEMEESGCCEERWRKGGGARRDGGKEVLRGERVDEADDGEEVHRPKVVAEGVVSDVGRFKYRAEADAHGHGAVL